MIWRKCAGGCGRNVKTYSLIETEVYCPKCLNPETRITLRDLGRYLLAGLALFGVVGLIWLALCCLGMFANWN